MAEEEDVNKDQERLCQGVSASDDSCDYPANVHCATCGKWFCDAHAEDDEWHQCMSAPRDDGSEA